MITNGSVSEVIDGHEYSCAVKLHKLLYEAFLTLALEGFQPWSEENHQEDIIHLEATLQTANNLCEEVSQTRFEETLKQN